MRVGSQTKLANVSHAVSFAMSTPYHLWPKKKKEKKKGEEKKKISTSSIEERRGG